MNIFITGQSGLIGTSLIKRLKQEGHKIVGHIDIRNKNEDIVDINSIKTPKNKIDLIIHTASHCKINQSISNPEKIFHSNVLGTFQVFEFARKNKIPKIIYFSSSRVLSKEHNPYTASKIYGENLCKAYNDSYGIKYIIIRPSTVYGPFWDKTKRLIHIWITNALKNKNIEIYGNPSAKTLDFTYIDDLIEGVILAMNHKWNKEYNISGENSYNLYKLAKEIIKKTKSESKIVIKDSEISQPQDVKCDIKEIKKIGYKSKIKLLNGVNECIKFYKKYMNI